METPSAGSLVRSGPFYRAQLALRFLTASNWKHPRRVVIAILLTWLPLVLLTLVTNRGSTRSLLTDYSINVRLLIAIPVLLVGQGIMDTNLRSVVRHIRTAKLLSALSQTHSDNLIAKLVRLRDSPLIELLIVAAVYVHIALIVQSRRALALPWAFAGGVPGTQYSLAGWYYILAGKMLLEFLLGLSLRTWLLWTYYLFRLSKMDLELVPTHPDQRCGLGFLGLSPFAIVPTIFAATLTISTT
jgi:hypothetical protein